MSVLAVRYTHPKNAISFALVLVMLMWDSSTAALRATEFPFNSPEISLPPYTTTIDSGWKGVCFMACAVASLSSADAKGMPPKCDVTKLETFIERDQSKTLFPKSNKCQPLLT